MSLQILHGKTHPCYHMLHSGKPLYSHGYPRPFDEAFHRKPFNIYTQKPGLYSYTPAQISSSLIKYTEQVRDLDPELKDIPKNRERQIQGLRQWKSLQSGNYEHQGTEELLGRYSECLDDLFFGGSLKGFYKIRFEDSATMPNMVGYCDLGRSFEHGFEIDIAIANKRCRKMFRRLGKPSQLRDYLGTLIHEMVHAVFDLYCCRTCTLCRDEYTAGLGISGHDKLWQKLAISIEGVLNQCPDFRGAVDVDLGRSVSFRLEYHGDEDTKANISLQDSLTIRQLLKLDLTPRTTGNIKGRLQARNKQRAAARRMEATDRMKGLNSKLGVQGGRISKENTPNSRH